MRISIVCRADQSEAHLTTEDPGGGLEAVTEMTVATGGPPPVTLCRVGVALTMGGVSGGADTECACAPLVRDTRGLDRAVTSPLPPLLVLRRVSLWLEILRLGSPLEVSDIEDIESRGSSSPLQSGTVMIKAVIVSRLT